MPNTCCVIGCTQGRVSDRPDVLGQETAIFRFPLDPVRSAEWLRKIRMPDLEIKAHTRICSRHFLPYFVKRRDQIQQPDGTIRSEPCTPSFTYDAFPSLLPPESNSTDIKYPSQRTSLEEKYRRKPTISVSTPISTDTSVQSLDELLKICATQLPNFSSNPQWIILPVNPNAESQDYFTVAAFQRLPPYDIPEFAVSVHISLNRPVRAFRGRTALGLPDKYCVVATSWESVKSLLEFFWGIALTTELAEAHENALLLNAADALELIYQQADAKLAQRRGLTVNDKETYDGDERMYTGLPENEDLGCADGSTDVSNETRNDDETENVHMHTTALTEADAPRTAIGINPKSVMEAGPASGPANSQMDSENAERKERRCRTAKEIASEGSRRAHLEFLVEQLRCEAVGPHRLRFSERTHTWAQRLAGHSSSAYDMIRDTGALILPHRRTLRRNTERNRTGPVVSDEQFQLRKPCPAPAVERSHECSDCGKNYHSAASLRSHLNNSTQNKDAEALEMVVSEANQEAIAHIKATQTFSYYCRKCQRHYPSKAVLDLHQYHHLSEVHQYHHLPEDTADLLKRKCPHCDYDGTCFSDLITHTLTHGLTRKDKKPCLICGRYFVIQSDHMRKCHRSLIKHISADWEHQCDECGERFKLKHALKLHGKMRHKGYQCIYCAKICYTALETGHHVLQHRNADGVFPCPMCDITCPVYRLLKTHYRDHHDVTKAQSCPFCRNTVPGSTLELADHVERCKRDASGSLGKRFPEPGPEVAEGQCSPCEQCGKVLSSQKAQYDHVHNIHPGHIKEKKQVTPERKRKEIMDTDSVPSKHMALDKFAYRYDECQLGFIPESNVIRHNDTSDSEKDTEDVVQHLAL